MKARNKRPMVPKQILVFALWKKHVWTAIATMIFKKIERDRKKAFFVSKFGYLPSQRNLWNVDTFADDANALYKLLKYLMSIQRSCSQNDNKTNSTD